MEVTGSASLEEHTPNDVPSFMDYEGPSQSGYDGSLAELPSQIPWPATVFKAPVSGEVCHVQPMDTDDGWSSVKHIPQTITTPSTDSEVFPELSHGPVIHTKLSNYEQDEQHAGYVPIKPGVHLSSTDAERFQQSAVPADTWRREQSVFLGQQAKNTTPSDLPLAPVVIPKDSSCPPDGEERKEIVAEAMRQAGILTIDPAVYYKSIGGHQPIACFKVTDLRPLVTHWVSCYVHGEMPDRQPRANWEEIPADVPEMVQMLWKDPNKTVNGAKPGNDVLWPLGVYLASRVPHHKGCKCSKYEPKRKQPSRRRAVLRPAVSEPTSLVVIARDDDVDGVPPRPVAQVINYSEEEQGRGDQLVKSSVNTADVHMSEMGENSEVSQKWSPNTETLVAYGVQEDAGNRSSSALDPGQMTDHFTPPSLAPPANQPPLSVESTDSTHMGGAGPSATSMAYMNFANLAPQAYQCTDPNVQAITAWLKEAEKTKLPMDALSGEWLSDGFINYVLTSPQAIAATSSPCTPAATPSATAQFGTQDSLIGTASGANQDMSDQTDPLDDLLALIGTTPPESDDPGHFREMNF